MRRKSSSAVPAVALFFLIAISSLSPFIFSQQDDTAGPLEFENIIPDEEFPIFVITILNNYKSDIIIDKLVDSILRIKEMK